MDYYIARRTTATHSSIKELDKHDVEQNKATHNRIYTERLHLHKIKTEKKKIVYVTRSQDNGTTREERVWARKGLLGQWLMCYFFMEVVVLWECLFCDHSSNVH